MVSHVVGRAILHTEVNRCWAVTSIECAQGLARLDLRPGLTQVVVGDTSDAVAGLDQPAAFAAAACTSDGEIVVLARRSPPAIALDSDGSRTTPAGGASRDSEFPSPGNRFLMLSSSAFENLSESLVTCLKKAPQDLIAQDPEDLLLSIFADLDRGAGAVIDRRAHLDPTGDLP